MCSPTAVMATTAVASTGWSLYSQHQAAERQERFYQRAREEQDKQLYQSKSQAADRRARAARAERARLKALSAESGLAGTTIDTILRNVDFQAGQDISAIELNRDNAAADAALRHQSNLNMINQPDYIGEALNAGLRLYRMGDQEGWFDGNDSPDLNDDRWNPISRSAPNWIPGG